MKNPVSVREVLYSGYIVVKEAESYCSIVTNEPGKCRFNLTSEQQAAQTYICVEPGNLTEASADVIWISDRFYNDSSTEDLVNLTCSIDFQGNWAPTIEWKEQSSEGKRVLSDGVNTTTIPNQHVVSSLVMPAQNGNRSYTCSAKFSIASRKSSSSAATNIPDEIEVWTFLQSQG